MKVKFIPQNVEFEIKPGQSVMHLAEDHGIYVKSVCRGVPSCAECRVKIVEGEANVFQPAGEELSLIGSGWFIDRRRLSCQLQCIGDVTVDMNEQLLKQQGVIGGRKSKAAKAVGDRIEDETVIRDSSAVSADRDRDREADEEADKSRDNRRERGPRGPGPRPQGAGGGIQPRTDGPSGGGIQPRTDSQPRTDGQGGSGPQPRGDGRGGGRRRR